MSPRRDDHSYEIGHWSDFVRGVVDDETERDMRESLAASAEARRQVAALELVAELARTEQESAPPEWAVRCAKALGSLQRPEACALDQSRQTSQTSWWQRLAMSLTFDSMTSPAMAGTRDAQGDDRQLVFEQGDYRVDVRIEPETNYQHSVLVGQLMHGDDEVEPLAEVPVLALHPGSSASDERDEQVVASTKTSRFGEFQAVGLPAGELDLLLLLDDHRCLQLNIPARPFAGNDCGGQS